MVCGWSFGFDSPICEEVGSACISDGLCHFLFGFLGVVETSGFVAFALVVLVEFFIQFDFDVGRGMVLMLGFLYFVDFLGR